jgi:hypothetical protein
VASAQGGINQRLKFGLAVMRSFSSQGNISSDENMDDLTIPGRISVRARAHP